MKTTFAASRGTIILIQTFLCSLLNVFMAGQGTASDIFCLKSIKDSLEDPLGYLSSSWDFTNNSEGFICRFNGVGCWHPDENRVLNLKLPNMGLKGRFPLGLENCTSLTGLDLSLNELSGPIPSDISSLLRYATAIDLSDNKFSGEIPLSLANLTYLNALKLDNNMFTGQIPQEFRLLPRIKSISFANNKLSGPVPAFDHGVATVDSYANNMGLCGGPLAPCSLDKRPMVFLQSFKDGILAGFAFSFTSVVVAYMSFCAPWTQLKRAKNKHQNKAAELGKYICSFIRRKTRIEASQIQELLPLQLQEKGSARISKLMERLTSTMRFDDLNDATDSFSIDNGVGKMGIMYKGALANDCDLVIKRLFDSQLFER